MVRLVTLATCNLNQWAMDFDLNLRNIEESIRQSNDHSDATRGYACGNSVDVG